MPFAVVVDEFFDVLLFGQAAEKEVVQDRVVQNHDAGFFQRSRVDVAMKLVVPGVIKLRHRLHPRPARHRPGAATLGIAPLHNRRYR